MISVLHFNNVKAMENSTVSVNFSSSAKSF